MSKEVGGMVGSRRVQGAGSARTEGARRASGVGADGAAVGAEALAPGQRWSASRKRDVVLRLLRGESLEMVSREVGVELYRLEAWQARALAGLELGLKEQAGEPLAAELDSAKRHIGELSMEIELLREACPRSGASPPFDDAEVATMSATTSAMTGRRYGLKRVCRTWERSRSALYARRARLQRPARGARPARRGPTPALSDAQLLAAIRTDLALTAEGHRKEHAHRSRVRAIAGVHGGRRLGLDLRGKVHARLRILDDIRVSRTRVLRVMRAQGLLSPHRGRQGEMKAHDGTIVTSAPDVMWGTDGVRVFTADDGWVWTFAAVDHWNAECVGWHVCKVGSRFAALEPIAQGLGRLYGSVEADVARGLALRMDHGSQYLSDHFLNQLRYWGIHPSFGFVEEPETNGVVERWNRTLKEQAVYGRVFRNLAEVRAAVAEFVVRYNQCWRLEKLAYRTPLEAREEYKLRQAA